MWHLFLLSPGALSYPPGQILDLAINAMDTETRQVELSWTAQGAVLDTGRGEEYTLVTRSMWQTWAHLGPTGPRWAPCWPHEPCYLVRSCNILCSSSVVLSLCEGIPVDPPHKEPDNVKNASMSWRHHASHKYWQTYNISRTKFQNFNVLSCRLAVVFVRSPTSDVPTTSEWSSTLLPTKVRLILEVWWYAPRPVVFYLVTAPCCMYFQRCFTGNGAIACMIAPVPVK